MRSITQALWGTSSVGHKLCGAQALWGTRSAISDIVYIESSTQIIMSGFIIVNFF